MARKSQMNAPLSINVEEKWGGLVDPETHTAAVGLRLCDNRRREFAGFANRRTVVGEYDAAMALQKWLYNAKTMRLIRKNTRFSRGLDDANEWSTTAQISSRGRIQVRLEARCSGEYCYVRAYADRIPSGMMRLEPATDGRGNKCWMAVMDGRPGVGTIVYGDTELDAMNALLDFVANELEANECLM